MDDQIVDQVVSDVSATDSSAVDSFLSYLSRFVYGQITGRVARAETDIRLLVGHEAMRHMSGLYRGTAVGDLNALEKLRQITGGVRVCAHLANATGTPKKQNVIVRRGLRAELVNPIWEGVQVVVDEITGVSTGAIKITAILLAAWKVTRDSGFKVLKSQHATS